jgi:4-hydroxybenzoate polyprenyltransferase/phosphoserine phosphatase
VQDAHAADSTVSTDAIPLCVDLDGTLTPVDTLHESLLDMGRRGPAALLRIPAWLMRGKAGFKQKVAEHSQIDASLLPLRQDLLDWLRAERSNGRRLVLATAANRQIAERVASRLDLFDEVVCSSETENLAGDGKRRALVQRFGEQGFDYAGNAAPDLKVWKSARRAIVVGDARLVAGASRVAQVERAFPARKPSLHAWLRAIRLHQWVKNALVFVPVLAAHRIMEAETLITTVIAFFAFNFCASSVYVVNDLLDLAADRRHPRKCRRPFASGEISARSGLLLAALLVAVSAALAWRCGLWFAAALVAYYAVTWAYSLRLKQAALVDVITLAALYTLRIVAGAAATLIVPSFWLLAFSMFVFLCLGFVKRYAELYDARQSGALGGHGRGYSSHDLETLLTMGMASGFSSVVVVALYINSPESQALYRHHVPMWLICPLLLYWIMRMWLLATRGQMNDDPVVFAIRDRISLVTLALVGLMVVAST